MKFRICVREKAQALCSGKQCHSCVRPALLTRAICVFRALPLSLWPMRDAAELGSGQRFLGRSREYWHLLNRGAVLLLLTSACIAFGS